MIKKRKANLVQMLDRIKPGKDILFADGIKGKVIIAGDEYLVVEVSKSVELTISRLSVNQVLEKVKTSIPR